MIFFLNEPLNPEIINTAELDQLRKFKEWCRKQYLYREVASKNDLFLSILDAISQHIDQLRGEPRLVIDAYKGLKNVAPAAAKPLMFRFPRHLLEDENVSLFIQYFEPVSDAMKDPDNGWIKKGESEQIHSWEYPRNEIYEHLHENWHHSFKFYVEVPENGKSNYFSELLKSGFIITGEGEPVPETPEKWRIWFLYAEAPVHPHYTGLTLLNQCLYKLPVSN